MVAGLLIEMYQLGNWETFSVHSEANGYKTLFKDWDGLGGKGEGY